jgi:exopolyphosphatase / guanosine-5'-triphosphate,3'-diphosphate pyrophosphatase
VSNGMHLGSRQALFLDVGGGSTEIIIGDQESYRFLDSLKLGALRLTAQGLKNIEKPVSSAKYDELCRYIRNAAVHCIQQIQSTPLKIAVGSSGTIANIADIAVRMRYKRKRERTDVLSYAQLREVIELLRSLPLTERRKIPGINPDRADILIAGAAIFDVLLGAANIKTIRISDRGLRDGLLLDYLARTTHTAPSKPVSVRLRSVLQLGRTCGFDETHARHVAELALQMFDSAQNLGLHKLGSHERELLEYSALLHDIGMFLSYENHQIHGDYLIRNADLLGFDRQELAVMATTALFHRRVQPGKRHPEFSSLDNRLQKAVRILSILLRFAESLDRSHIGAVSHVEFRRTKKRRWALEITPASDCQLELWGLSRHVDAFTKIFHRNLLIELTAHNEGILLKAGAKKNSHRSKRK